MSVGAGSIKRAAGKAGGSFSEPENIVKKTGKTGEKQELEEGKAEPGKTVKKTGKTGEKQEPEEGKAEPGKTVKKTGSTAEKEKQSEEKKVDAASEQEFYGIGCQLPIFLL